MAEKLNHRTIHLFTQKALLLIKRPTLGNVRPSVPAIAFCCLILLPPCFAQSKDPARDEVQAARDYFVIIPSLCTFSSRQDGSHWDANRFAILIKTKRAELDTGPHNEEAKDVKSTAYWAKIQQARQVLSRADALLSQMKPLQQQLNSVCEEQAKVNYKTFDGDKRYQALVEQYYAISEKARPIKDQLEKVLDEVNRLQQAAVDIYDKELLERSLAREKGKDLRVRPAGDWQDREKRNLLNHHFNKDSLAYRRGQSLPNLLQGNVEAIGKATPLFNCYGYAANPGNPPGWVAVGQDEIAPGAKRYANIIKLQGGQDLVKFFDKHGWQVVSFDHNPPKPGEERIILWARNPGQPYKEGVTHAAIWRSDGVYAKMGDLGTFRFDSIDQLNGGYFGEAWYMFTRKP